MNASYRPIVGGQPPVKCCLCDGVANTVYTETEPEEGLKALITLCESCKGKHIVSNPLAQQSQEMS